MLPSFDEIYSWLLKADESNQVEAKRSEELGQSCVVTVCAFANEPDLGGGYMLLGVSRIQTDSGNQYEVTGVRDSDKVTTDLANQCYGQFNIKIRPEMAVHVTETGKKVVIVRIHEAEPAEKPVYFVKQGLPKGAYRRIFSADCACTQADVALLYRLRGSGGLDDSIAAGVDVSELDPAAIREYRRARAEVNASAEELKYKNADLLRAIKATQQDKGGLSVTKAGLILFGTATAIKRHMPWARVEYTTISGTEWSSEAAQNYRNVEVRQGLMLAVPKIVDLVLSDLPRSFKLHGKRLRRREVPAIPLRVVREAVVNAVMHRDYSVHSPVQIRKFSNRLEITNPGYSLVSAERLGGLDSKTRNPRIADVLRDTGYAEVKGTGIAEMRDQMRRANLSLPLFVSSRDEDRFDVSLLTHHLMDEDTVRWLSGLSAYGLSPQEANGLAVLRQLGYLNNAAYRDANAVDVFTASNQLRRLRDLGLLEVHNKGSATFYTPSARLGNSVNYGASPPLKHQPSYGDSAPTVELSPDVLDLIRRVGKRSDTKQQRELVHLAILRLCALRPMRADELSRLLSREAKYLQRRILKPMFEQGLLQRIHSEKPTHPTQAYITSPLLGDVQIPDEKAPPKQRGRRKTRPGQRPLL